MSPQRIQLRRTKGWRKPEGAIVVARPSKWGNPWRIVEEKPTYRDGCRVWYRIRHVETGEGMGAWGVLETARKVATSCFRENLEQGRLPYTISDVQRDLAGHDLACWCPPSPLCSNGSIDWLGLTCHADVLLQIANQP